MNDLTQALQVICERLSADDTECAVALAREHYPLPSLVRDKRAYTPLDLTRTAMRDGFIDRYAGKRLVFPGALRLLSVLLPGQFPYQANWAYDRCHPMYWELYPTLDHVVPIARGGKDAPENWVVTSQQMNSAKAHWTLEELGWKRVPPGSLADWDGLMAWFDTFIQVRPELPREHKCLRDWRAVARKAAACVLGARELS
jgi:hypothetical protein